MTQRFRYIREELNKFFDIIFPPSAESLTVRSLDSRRVLALLEPKAVRGGIALAHFKTSDIRALIHEAKFHCNAHAIVLLGTLLRSYLEEQRPKEGAVFIPIPLSGARMRSRGYNQVELILKQACIGTNFRMDAGMLVRTRDTRPQTELAREERGKNVADAFAVRTSETIGGRALFLIDDVLTTGATLSAAKAALLPHCPASVTCIALAH